ncbi:MAG: hypothetical protein A4E28_02172 [Methanocella sp. PtaU1.Bin125]|nr:MAG: hypothetical protein A4E28_02172 [Methanocella sp. PtaU1.Bin125]
MRKQMIITAAAVVAVLSIVVPAVAQVPCGIPAGCGIGAPFGGFGPGPVGCGIGLPFGLGSFGVGLPFGNIVAVGLAMMESVLGAAFGFLGLGGPGGWGLPFC